MRPRGASLLGVMALSMVVVTLLLVLSSASVARLTMAARSRGEAQARYAAESALARAAAAFLEDRPRSDGATPADLVLEDPETGSSARLTYRPDAGLPYSVNNWDKDTSRTGWGGFTVPGRSLHLVAVGRSRGVERVLQTVLHIPPFPYVIASSGVVRSDGGLRVTGVADARDVTLKDGVLTLAPEKETSGHVASNGTGDPALLLGPDTEVTGDVRSAGKISLDPAALVRGEVRPEVDPIGIPGLDLRSYDPATRPGLQTLTEPTYPNGTYTDRLTLEGFVRRAGDLEVTSKGLLLKGAVLFVDGNLKVSGPVEGRGALIVTGRCQLIGGATLSTDNEAALLVGGDVEIRGAGRQSTFAGLVYTEGNFTAEDITLVGAFVANHAGGSAMQMTRVNLVSLPGVTEFSVAPRLSLPATPPNQTRTYWIGSRTTEQDLRDPAAQDGQPPYKSAVTAADAKIEYFVQGSGPYTKAQFLSRISRVPLPSPTQRPGACGGAGVRTWTDYVNCEEARIVEDLSQAVREANEAFLAGQETPIQFSLDLNRFVSIEDRVRTTYWSGN